jgi:transposase-like protein
MRLSDMWWQHIHVDAPSVQGNVACSHTTLLSRWSIATSGPPGETVEDWVCAACHRVFTTEDRETMRKPAAGAAARSGGQPPPAG